MTNDECFELTSEKENPDIDEVTISLTDVGKSIFKRHVLKLTQL